LSERAGTGSVALLLLALAPALASLGCGGAAAPAVSPLRSRTSLLAPAGARGAHTQIVRALDAPARAEVVRRFRARNGPGWSIALGAGAAPDDVDAIRGIVRRAHREGTSPDQGPGAVVVSEAAASEAAIRFVSGNADFLGVAASELPVLDVSAAPARTTTYGTWVVHLRGTSPMRGYEGFDEIASAVDILVYLGDDGQVRYFVNLSRVHPQLDLDTHPLLGPDDARVVRHVVGRELFVVIDDPARRALGAHVRELRRVPLGAVDAADVRDVRLGVFPSPGPAIHRGSVHGQPSYVSYWLAYFVFVVRRDQPFRFVVDADTGDLLDDAQVPVVDPVAPPPDPAAPSP